MDKAKKKQQAATTTREQRLCRELLYTWQPVAALAIRCKMPVRAALSILLEMERKGQVQKVRTRIDGHNRVHLFRVCRTFIVMGVQIAAIDVSEEM